MKKALLVSVAAVACALPVVSSAQDKKSDFSVSGNLSFVSDYRFRGISQTVRGPAIQGGFDVGHSSGAYVGTWASNVSSNQYLNGAGLEWDLYGGYKFEPVKGLTLDAGGLYYWYPKAEYANGDKYNNFELYFGASYFGFTAKINYALTDYFGLNDQTNGIAGAGSGGSDGTFYVNGGWSGEVAPKLTANASIGYTKFSGYGRFDYGDVKAGVTYDLNGWLLGLNGVGTFGLNQQGKDFNTAATTSGPKKLYRNTVVLSVGRTF